MFSEKGKPLKIVNGFKFRRDRNVKVGISWRCSEKSCSARIYTDDRENILHRGETVHNHEVPTIKSRQLVANSLKIKILDTISTRSTQLVDTEVVKLGVSNDFTEDDRDSVCRSIYRKKRSILPPLPKFLYETHSVLDDLNVRSLLDENMTIINDPVHNIVGFSTARNLKCLCDADTILLDGTFDSCPQFFYQLFTIHIFKNGHYAPLVWAILPSKLEDVYRMLFEKLVNVCRDVDIVFRPKVIVADFEVAIRSAAKKTWEDVQIVGCRFHLGQAWYRKIQECGLSTVYQDHDSEISKWLSLNFGLPFLQSNDVADCFVVDVLPLMPVDRRVFLFAEYLLQYYIFDESLFPPSQWAEATLDSQRTTNACEAFHSSFAKNFSSPRPNIFVFLEAIKKTQSHTHTILNSLELPKKRKRSKKIVNKKTYIEQCLADYLESKIDSFTLIKNVKYHYAPT